MNDDRRVAVLGVGMHPWGKWGRNFVEYGLAAARAALADAGVGWRDIEFVSGADTIRNGYPGFVSGATFAQALGWTGARVSSVYAACASGAAAIGAAQGADPRRALRRRPGGRRRHDPEGLLRSGRRRAPRRSRLVAVLPTRRDEPGLLRALRQAAHGSLRSDRRGLRSGEGQERLARPGEPERQIPQGGHRRGGTRLPDGGRSAAAARDLRHLRRRGRRRLCRVSTSPSATAATVRRPGHDLGGLDGHPDVPEHRDRDAELRNRLGRNPRRRRVAKSTGSGTRSPTPHTRRPGSVPRTSTSPRSTTCRLLSSSTGTRTSGSARPGEAEKLLRDGDTRIGGRVPVNPSGGLSCFGEAIPAQAIAQVCECVWQLRGQADGPPGGGRPGRRHRQPGLFGHGSSVAR